MSDLVSLQDHPEFAQLQRALVTHPEASAPPARAEKPDISKVLGEKLQSGWCLRAEHCPLCHAPLMSKANDMFCFGCNLPVRREEDLPPNYTLNKQVAPSDKPQESHTHATDNSGRNGDSDSAKKSKKDSEKGELPELEDLDGLPEKELMLDEDGDFEFDAEAFARARKKSDEVSEKIGKHMLMGWTLMDVHCSTDFCPLMRSADRKTMLCLSCGTEYEEEGEEEDIVKITTSSSAQKEPPVKNAPSSTSPSSPPMSAAPAPSSAPRSSSSSSSASSSSSLASSAYSTFSSSTSPSFPSSNPAFSSSLPSNPASAELLQLEQVLMAKVVWLRGLMAETWDVSECCRYADTIRALLSTLAALSALRR